MSPFQLVEIGLLAAARSDIDKLGAFVAALDGYDFTSVPLAWVFERMAASFGRGELPNPVTMVAEAEIEGPEFAEQLREAIEVVWRTRPTRSMASDLATLRKRHQGRTLTKTLNHAVKLMERGDLDGAGDILRGVPVSLPLRSPGSLSIWPSPTCRGSPGCTSSR